MNSDDLSQGVAAPSWQARALDAFAGCLRHAEAMILRTEEVRVGLAAAVPPRSAGPVMVALHSAWADLDARLLRSDVSAGALWAHPTMQLLLRASFSAISKGIEYYARQGSAAADVLRQLRQLMERLKSHGQAGRAVRLEGAS